MSTGRRVRLVVAIAAAVAGATMLWRSISKLAPEAPTTPPAASVPSHTNTVTAPPEPAIKHPLEGPGAAPPLVLLAEAVDTASAVDLYIRLYPLLQRAYEELGYPKRDFDDRLIEVIDRLLVTPEAAYPVKVRLTEVKGSVPSVRPWVRYELADPALESLSAGQKILLRVGPANQRRLKAKLAGIRQELIKRVTPR